MRSRPTLALALLSALTGCVGSPPKGPLVEFRENTKLHTRPAPCEATYALRATDPPAAQPLTALHLKQGDRVGFRREPDGSILAVGPEFAMYLQPGTYVWEVVPGSVPSWKKRAKHEFIDALKITGLLALAVTLLGIGLLAGGDDEPTPKPGPGEPNGVILRGHPHTQNP